MLMLDQLLAAIQLKKEIPDAIGYDTYGPIGFPAVPSELKSAMPDSVANELKSLTGLNLRIDNFSSRAQKNVRVLYSGEYQYSPKIAFHWRTVDVKYDVNWDDKEITIAELPPNESVSIKFFNVDQHFNIEQVLLGDRAVTKFMQQLAEAKRYPEIVRMKLFTVSATALAVCVSVAIAYFTWNQMRENNIINSAHAGLSSCSPYLFDNPPEKEKTLERKFNQLGFWSNFVLSLNKASSFDELKLKDQVILCEPNKP